MGRDDGGSFCDAVSFRDRGMRDHLLDLVEHGLRAFFRTENDHPKRIEIAGFGPFQDVTQKSRRAGNEGRLVARSLAGQCPGIGRVGMVNDSNSSCQR